MNTLHVSPAVTINGSDGADISHDLTTQVQVTATEPTTNAKQTFYVQPGQKYHWTPPEGWDDVKFTAEGFQQETRAIAWEAALGGEA